MKYRIIESHYKPQYESVVIWEGEADTVQFCASDTKIGIPNWVRFEKLTNCTIISYSYPCNIRVRVEEKDGSTTAWCEPAITVEDLQKLQKQREQKQRERQSKLCEVSVEK